jgi:putative salt-induced outer membrane protein
MKKFILASTLLTSLSMQAVAMENLVNAGKDILTGWKGDIEAGATFSNGNDEEKEYNLDLKVQKEGDAQKWGYKFEAYAEGEEKKGVTTDEEYRALIQARYNVSETGYVFGEFAYLNNRFEGYKSRTTETVGYGHKFYNNEEFKLSGEVSLGMRQTEFTDETDENSFITKLSADAMYKINPQLSLVQELEIGLSESTTLLSETALKYDFTSNFYGKLAYELESNSDVPAGTKETDTTIGFKIGYSF